ncbi:YchJ family protein [Shewanella aestuarii]|uniref:YchJ family protein n=1 Tax=Shewanella aestuarii TaxID=1028752 RepID=A0A6G9QJF2_9GAMM|nr:YchJ family protein [Shewanella aestuarii]QIR14518.1 YchJ family protein [Shewanella aestuarii]
MINQQLVCPCNSQLAYHDCCSRFHNHHAVAPTAEVLMRSRYSAFALKQYDYLIATHHKDFLNGLSKADLSNQNIVWLGLDVIEHQSRITHSIHQFDGCIQASVTFKAWYKLDAKVDVIYEKSYFVKQDGQWYYTNGEQMVAKLPGRNDACICQSGKKFKQCCLKNNLF